MIYKMVSSKAVVAKIIADLNLREDKIKITDISEWVSEAMEKIGAVTQLDNKTAVIELKNYQAKLPCDLYRLNFVAYASGFTGGWIPMKKSTGVFSVCDKVDCCKHPHMLIQDSELIPLVKNLFNLTSDKKALDIINNDKNIRQTLSALLNQYTWDKHPYALKGTNFSPTVQYDIKPGFLYSNIRDGFVKIQYSAIYTDEEGMPMIPDMPSYFEAIYWYVAMKLIFIEYYNGTKPQALYYDAKRSWNFYRNQAYAEAMLPNGNEIENIKDTWHTLIPEYEAQDEFYSTTGDEQHILNWNR